MRAHNEQFDLIVIGAGAAGMTAASVAAAESQRVLLLEHCAQVGGTTAISGGMVWIPVNHKMAEAGLTDSAEAACSYLAHTVPPAEDDRPLMAFVEQGPAAIRYLEERTSVQLQPVRLYPDYYQDAPGATTGGRVLEPVPFDARVLDKSFGLLRPPLPEFMLLGGMMISRGDIPHLRRFWRSPASAWRVARLVARYMLQRMRSPRGTTLHLGNALAARLFKSALDLGVELRRESRVLRLLRGDSGVNGVEMEYRGVRHRVAASKGVILACGGISHDLDLRRDYVPELVGTLSATVDPKVDRSGAALAIEVGARMSPSAVRQGYWSPVSTFERSDGSAAVFPHSVTDRGKPGIIAIDQSGNRFLNEGVSYHEFVLRQLKAGQCAVPAYLVCDRRFLWKFGLGRVKPFTSSISSFIASGYLRRGATLPRLASALNVPAAALESTIAEFNADARRGTDTRFGRGSDAYQRHMGDIDHTPNPCVAPIEHPPYFAVEVRPADLGMAAGLVTDEFARVLDSEGCPIPGLYACGNDMQSVMNGAYPGPGITLGPALVFGYIAARHASRADGRNTSGE
jgi:succinate dehydrogenase/fumarate reductase flavoprotein subunit